MKKTLVSILTAVILPIAALADGYSSLWKQYEAAGKKDLPKTQIEILDKITKLAQENKNYGNLLSAEVDRIVLTARISPDSITPSINRLESKAENCQDKALASIYYCVIGDAYGALEGTAGFGNAGAKKKLAYYKAMEDPDALAKCSALSYQPLMKKGVDSKIFNNDLLSVIGYKTECFDTLNKYYDKAGNRTAAMLTALEQAKVYKNSAEWTNNFKANGNAYLAKLDSLIKIYGDLPECGEVALERYQYMNRCSDVEQGQKAEYINMALKRWANWRNTPQLKSEYEKLTQPMFGVKIPDALLPNVADTITADARNIKELNIALTRLNLSGSTYLNAYDNKGWSKLKPLLIPSTRIEIKTPVSALHEYDSQKLNIVLPGLKPGLYVVEMSADNKELKTQRSILTVSDIYVVSMYLPKNKIRIAVLNATTGQPVARAKIEVRYSNDTYKTFTADNNGETTLDIKTYDIERIRAYTANDNYMQFTGSWGNFNSYSNDQKSSQTAVFTDRAIYRPGQEVHASAVAYDIDGIHSTKVASGKEITFTLYNANHKVVDEKKATTDNYGTAAVSFSLPEGNSLNGRFSIRCTGNGIGSKWFRVEEYKRPTFEVKIDDANTEYHNGDTVTVIGHATTYSGIPVQEAKVAYDVTRSKSRWLWRFYNSSDENKKMLADTVATDAEGKFSIRIPVIMPQGYEENSSNDNAPTPKFIMPEFYTFTATATITDGAGESHAAETSITLGSRPTSLAFDFPEKTIKDSVVNVTFRRLNASAKEIEGTVTYWFDSSSEKFTAKANENVVIDWNKMKNIASGRHTMWATCGNDTTSQEFILFGIDDKRPAVDTPDWTYISGTTFPKDGKPVYVQVGSSRKDTHILYSIIAGKEVLESGSLDVSDSIITIPYTYKEEYGEGLLLNFVWVKDGMAYPHKFNIARPMQDKTLTLKWITFRDKLTPGQKETWTLNISRPDNKDIINKKFYDEETEGSQLLALMYDKSLDQIAKYDFGFNLALWQNLPSSRWNTMQNIAILFSSEADINWFTTKPLSYNWLDYDFDDLRNSKLRYAIGAYPVANRPLYIRGNSTMAKEEASITESVATSDRLGGQVLIKKDSMVTSESNDGNEQDDNTDDKDNGMQSGLQFRENLNETAFFYPALFADKKGNVNISFTLPESVTTWNFRGFAHDRNMNYGTISADAVASKQVMVMPNVPRFVRTGDNATITTRVANTTGKEILSTVTMQIIEPETEKVIFSKNKKVKIEANSTENVSFSYAADGNTPLLICRISAEGKNFSDGEQHYLPILPNAERVINTVPFTFLKSGKKEVALDSIFPNGAKDKKLTVEYTANPSWLMIQALPYMAEITHKNAISVSSAYYANVIGKYIMNKKPIIKKVVALWKKEGKDDNGSLMSALEKNQELKSLILEETPWVIEADKETEQKKMISSFFDESMIDYRIESQFNMLKDLQNENGSWSWFKGMDGSKNMTAQVVEMLARIKTMTNDIKAVQIMNKGLNYLASIAIKEYDEMKKNEKAGKPVCIDNGYAIQYLYVNSLLNRKLSAKENTVKDYLLDKLRKDRQRNIFAKARMANILNNNGNAGEAKEYVESIKQYTVAKPEMGRYFDTPRAEYSWFDYRIPTQTAAIEAIKAVEPEDKTFIDEMRLWLMQSKRTQLWDTPINSVNAVYAFLDGNCNELTTANAEGMSIAVDRSNKQLPTVSAGLGYMKTSFDIDSQKTLTITKSTDGTSWGAAYAQFMQNVADVTDNTSGIGVKREIVALNGNAKKFSVGDRIKVRITITADRDYDFVQLTDKRAACMEPVKQISGYGWGYYCSPKDNVTNYFFDRLSKGTHVVETEYYIDRPGNYTTGICTAQCAYAPEFCGRTGAESFRITE